MADNLRAGVRVRLHSLKAATHHNDAEGYLLEWNDMKGRWDVRLSSGEVLSVRPANLLSQPEQKVVALEPVRQTALAKEDLREKVGVCLRSQKEIYAGDDFFMLSCSARCGALLLQYTAMLEVCPSASRRLGKMLGIKCPRSSCPGKVEGLKGFKGSVAMREGNFKKAASKGPAGFTEAASAAKDTEQHMHSSPLPPGFFRACATLGLSIGEVQEMSLPKKAAKWSNPVIESFLRKRIKDLKKTSRRERGMDATELGAANQRNEVMSPPESAQNEGGQVVLEPEPQQEIPQQESEAAGCFDSGLVPLKMDEFDDDDILVAAGWGADNDISPPVGRVGGKKKKLTKKLTYSLQDFHATSSAKLTPGLTPEEQALLARAEQERKDEMMARDMARLDSYESADTVYNPYSKKPKSAKPPSVRGKNRAARGNASEARERCPVQKQHVSEAEPKEVEQDVGADWPQLYETLQGRIPTDDPPNWDQMGFGSACRQEAPASEQDTAKERQAEKWRQHAERQEAERIFMRKFLGGSQLSEWAPEFAPVR